jgi:hypothetical protein
LQAAFDWRLICRAVGRGAGEGREWRHDRMLRKIIKIILGLIPGIIVGAILVVVTNSLLVNAEFTKVNGWRTIYGCGLPGNGLLLQSACAQIFPAVNVSQEAMYWTTNTYGAGNLSGQHDYILHFPPGGLPPNNAFWSLTMGDARNRFVPNPINRSSVGSLTGLVPNADSSIDIYIQHTAPAGHESNWLPAPSGTFILWMRVYLPGPSVVNGKYQVPPVQEVQ